MLDTFPYPWTNSRGLSYAIDDPSLWASAFAAPENSELRHAIKRAVKRALPKFGVLRVDDHRAFGAAVVRLLSSPDGRKELEKQRFSATFQSVFLLDALCSKYSDVFPNLDEFAPTAADNLRALNAARMRTWLSSNPLDDRLRPVVVAVLCAFAMRKQEDARVLADELATQDNGCRILLAERVSATAEHKSSRPQESKSGKQKRDRIGAGGMDSANDVVGTVVAAKDFQTPLTVTEWRRNLAQRHEQLFAEETRLAELDQLAAAVADDAHLATNIPWLQAPLEIEDLWRLRETATPAEEMVRLQEAQAELARLLRAHAQAETLCQRFGRQPVRSIPGGSVNLAEVTAELENLSSGLAAEAEAMSRVIQQARSFLDQLAAGDVATAVDMCEHATPETWSALARLLFDPVFNTAEIGDLRANLTTEKVGAALLAQLMRSDPSGAATLVQWLFSATSETPQITRASVVLGFLSLEELQKAASAVPAAAEVVALLIFARALRQNRAELLDSLTPLIQSSGIDAISRGFYRTLIESWHRGRLTTPAADLRKARAVGDQAQAAEAAAERQHQRLLVWLDSPPGMKRTFHLLRVYAQLQFLHPLRGAIEKRDAADAWQQWQAFGPVNQMVDQCIAHLKRTDRPEARHYEQTQAYLDDFAADLERWFRLSVAPDTEARAELIHAIEVLRAEAPRNTVAATVLEAVEAGENIAYPMLDFTEMFDGEDRLRTQRIETVLWLSPTMLATWPRALEGEARLAHLLTDTLREGLAKEEITLARAIETYLAAGQLEAARVAATGHSDLEAKVDAVFMERRRALCEGQAALLQEAERAAEVDPTAAEYLGLVRNALTEDDFAEASAALELLGECMAEFRRRHDPVRQALAEWASEASAKPAAEASVAELEKLCADLRSSSGQRRKHIESLTSAAKDPRAAEPVQTLWAEAARQFDRPRLWPDVDTAELLAEAILSIGKKLRGKWQTRLDDRDPSTTVVRRIAEWLPMQLQDGLPAVESALDAVLKLEEMLAEGCGDAALLRFVGGPAQTAPATEPKPVAPPARTAAPSVPKVEMFTAPEPQRIAILQGMLLGEPSALTADFSKLRLAARAGRWAEARALAAALACSTPTNAVEVREDLLAVFGAAKFAETTGVSEWLPEAVAAVLKSRRADYYLGEQVVAEFAPRALLRVLTSSEEGSFAQQLAGALERAADLQGSDPTFLQLGEFVRATNAAPRLGEVLWSTFTGLPRVEQPRAALLRLLFRMHESDALRHLVEKSTVDKVRPVISACLDAFIIAETQPEARPVALQLSAALRTQAAGVANTLPWVLLFHSVQGIRDESESGSVQIDLDSDFPWQDADVTLKIDVRVKPSLFDPPKRLNIRLGNTVPITLCEEPLFTERVVSIPLPANLEFGPDGESRVTFTVQGVTVLGANISQANAWTIVRAERAQPIEMWQIETLWPGAKRDPVLRNHGFFGREREIREIESRLLANPRSRSVMLFGERRIGKTSLIRNLIVSFPPKPGRICGVFCDVSGLHPAPGELAVKFFDRVVTSLTVESDNGPIVETLRNVQGHAVTVKELIRGLNPGASLYAALEGLSQRIKELSGGVISRLALFIDEFDLFVVPMLHTRREEVNQLMWELRQVIQRSNCIAVVLAGSGLQRLYKENYRDALYGSIDEVSLFRFDWERDRQAILGTFLPESVRLRLCRPQDIERVTRRAAEICDGHPMFLALLGSAAAKFAKGRFLTPSLLDRTVAAMMREHELIGGEAVERQVFYGFIFKQLEVVPVREAALAKHLLAVLAQHTLPEDRSSSLRINQLFEISGLLGSATTSELLQVLDRLAKIDAVRSDRVAGRVRISVPLTAAAVREDAPRLREEAREELRLSTLAK